MSSRDLFPHVISGPSDSGTVKHGSLNQQTLGCVVDLGADSLRQLLV